MKKTPVITFDIDWAPDWAVRFCHDLCKSYNIPATFFVTHESDVLDELRNDPNIEMGIHPNMLPGSTHGEIDKDIIQHCIKLVPEATSMRTHGLYQTSRFFAMMGETFPGIDTDVSIYLPRHPDLKPTSLFFGSQQQGIKRLPYYWEDDFNAMSPTPDWINAPPSNGLSIFNFHPIHICLNMCDLEAYEALKRRVDKSLHLASECEIKPFVNYENLGTRTFFHSIIEELGRDCFTTIADISKQYRFGDEC